MWLLWSELKRNALLQIKQELSPINPNSTGLPVKLIARTEPLACFITAPLVSELPGVQVEQDRFTVKPFSMGQQSDPEKYERTTTMVMRGRSADRMTNWNSSAFQPSK